MKKLLRCHSRFILACILLLPTFQTYAQVNGTDRNMAIGHLEMTKEAIKKNYYDPTYHGVDIDFVFDQAKERMKVAPTRDALMLTIASAVLSLNDSHTTFVPPVRAAEVEYGWTAGVIGDDCYITHVKPGSDAEAKGLKPGDRLFGIDNFRPTRKNLWQMSYRYFVVAPAARVNMTILSPGDEKPRTLSVDTKIERSGGTITLQQWYDRTSIKGGFTRDKAYEFVRNDNGVMLLKLHTFSLTNDQWDILQGKIRSAKSVVLDLRDNGGGSVDILKKMVGFFFDKEVKLFDEKRRKESKPLVSKPSSNGFKGDLTVLINEGSASASEVFSRLVQLEKRGKVIGDKSMGAVMESQLHVLDSGIGSMLIAGTSVTMADLVMSDGKSLEKVGVIPDEVMLPKGADLAATRDPVLAYAAKLSSFELTPEAAGKLFPYVWRK